MLLKSSVLFTNQHPNQNRYIRPQSGVSMSEAVKINFEGSKLLVIVDPNKDGQAVVKLEVELAEIPDEVLSAIQAKKAQA